MGAPTWWAQPTKPSWRLGFALPRRSPLWGHCRNPALPEVARSGKALFTSLNILLFQNYFLATVEDELNANRSNRLLLRILPGSGYRHCLFGWWAPPISWQLAGLVWGLAVVGLLITDPLNVVLYRILNHRGVIFHRGPSITTQDAQ